MQLVQRQVVTIVVLSANSPPFDCQSLQFLDVAETLASRKWMCHLFFAQSPLFRSNFGIILPIIIGIFESPSLVAVKRKSKRPAPFAMAVSIGHVPYHGLPTCIIRRILLEQR
jgi:hypothetical protein